MRLSISFTDLGFFASKQAELNITQREALDIIDSVVSNTHSSLRAANFSNTVHSLRLSNYYSDQNIQLIKDIRRYTGCSLVTAKRILDRLLANKFDNHYEEELLILPGMEHDARFTFLAYCHTVK
jgi:ribosomal protein L7/L12